MATKRKRWFRVADSVLREDWTRDQRSTFLGLLAWFNQRRARDGCSGASACEAPIPPGDLLTITLADSLEEARQLLADSAPVLHLEIEERGRFTFVRWSKLLIFQEWECPGSEKLTPEPRKTRARARQDSRPRSEKLTPLPNPYPNRTETEPKPSERGAEDGAPPGGRNPLANLLGDCGVSPPPERDEREEWARIYGPECEAAADSELPDDASTRQRGAAIKRIALARWRVYLRSDRPLRGIGARRKRAADLERIKAAAEAVPAPPDSDDFDLPMEVLRG